MPIRHIGSLAQEVRRGYDARRRDCAVDHERSRGYGEKKRYRSHCIVNNVVLCTLWLKLGRVRLNEGQFAQAEQLGRKALSIAGGNLAFESEALDLISGALRAQGRLAEANQIQSDASRP